MAAKTNNSRQRLELTEASLNREIFHLAWPAVVSQTLFSLVSIVDTIIVGWLKNPSALAAAGLTAIFMWFLSSPFYALSISASSLVSRYWGEEDFATAKKYAAQSMAITFLMTATILLVVWIFADFFLGLFNAGESVMKIGVPYLKVIIYSGIFGMPMVIANSIIRATGDTKTPLTITALMNGFNIVISIILAFGLGPFPAMGLMGVAWGTVAARLYGLFIALFYLRYSSKSVSINIFDILHIDPAIYKRIWLLTYPAALDRTLSSIAHLLFMRIVATLGTTALAAHTIALQVESMAFMPAAGIAVAARTIVGQAIGANRIRIAELSVARCFIFSALFMLLLGAIFVLTANAWVPAFGATPDVLKSAALCIQISALELPFLAFSMLFASALSSAGDTKSPLYVSLSCMFIFRLGAVYLLAITFHTGLVGVWIGTALDWALRSFGLWLFYRKGKWKHLHVKEKAKLE